MNRIMKKFIGKIKKMNCRLRLLFFTLTIVALSGCCTTSMLEREASQPFVEPVKREKTCSISFYRLILDVPPGQKIGGYFEGLLRVRMDDYYWESSISVGSDVYNIEANRLLKKYGYNVFGMENILFGLDESAKARFHLGGTLTDIRQNIYGRFAGEFSEAQVFITWELYDTLTQKVVFKHSNQGYGKSGQTDDRAVYNAFRQSLECLLSNEEFIRITSEEESENLWQEQETNAQFINIGGENQPLSLPEDIEQIMDAVVSIKAGQTHGTGFAISRDGYILTASHVVSGLNKVHIVTKSGKTLQAEVLKFDRCNDVALIKTYECIFNPLQLELENRTPVGSELFAIGTPLSESLSWSTSKGILSGYRDVDGKKCIQTDTSLNPGNSGGPLLNKEGKVVGVVSWKISAVGVEGISFGLDIQAVPTVLGLTFYKNPI